MELDVTRTIAAPAGIAWRVLAEVERWPDWTPTVARVERLDSGPLGVGSRVRITQPKLRPGIWTVTEWNPGRSFTWIQRAPGLRIVADHSVGAGSRGSTLELRVRFEGLLGGFVGRIYGRLTERYMNLEADGLRSRCERAVASR